MAGPLIELFTSEGCSSCPPADRLLGQIDAEGGAVVLSLHVDYWNYLGWRDPFSARSFSERQANYGERFRRNGVYTPQAVINGSFETVGSEEREVRAALRRSRSTFSGFRGEAQLLNARKLRVHVEREAVGEELELWVAVAQRNATVAVARGENGGKTLHHVAIARSLRMLGRAAAGESGAKEFELAVDPQWGQLRVVAWWQQPGLGTVRGALRYDL